MGNLFKAKLITPQIISGSKEEMREVIEQECILYHMNSTLTAHWNNPIHNHQ